MEFVWKTFYIEKFLLFEILDVPPFDKKFSKKMVSSETEILLFIGISTKS